MDKFGTLKCQRLIVTGEGHMGNDSEAVEVTTAIKALADAGEYNSIHYGIGVEAGASNVCTCTIQALDAEDADIASVCVFDVYFSDSSAGAGLASTWVIDSVTASTGSLIKTNTSVKHYTVMTDATGKAVLSLTDTAKGAGYVCVISPLTGKVTDIQAVVTGSYGS